MDGQDSGIQVKDPASDASAALSHAACHCHGDKARATDAQTQGQARTQDQITIADHDDLIAKSDPSLKPGILSTQHSSASPGQIYGTSLKPPALVPNNTSPYDTYGRGTMSLNVESGPFTLQAFDSIVCDIDASSSMSVEVNANGNRLELVQKGLDYMVDHRDRSIPFEVRAFGNGPDCTSTSVLVDLEKHTDDSKIKHAINSLKPTGGTPLAYSIHRCVDDAFDQKVEAPVLIVGTDGGEGCRGDVCHEVERFFQTFPKGQLIVLGIDPEALDQFNCGSLAAYKNQMHIIDAKDPQVSLENVQAKMNDVRKNMNSDRATAGQLDPNKSGGENAEKPRRHGISETSVDENGKTYRRTKLEGIVLPKTPEKGN